MKVKLKQLENYFRYTSDYVCVVLVLWGFKPAPCLFHKQDAIKG